MTSNSFSIGCLLKDASLLKKIIEAPGIYKIFVRHEDKNKVKFVAPSDEYPTILQKVYNRRLACLGITAEQYAAMLQTTYNANIENDETENIDNHVIYIGESDNLQRRAQQCVQMPRNGTQHRGGSDIWLIRDYENFLYIEWYTLSSSPFATVKEYKKYEINEFKKRHNHRLPVANK